MKRNKKADFSCHTSDHICLGQQFIVPVVVSVRFLGDHLFVLIAPNKRKTRHKPFDYVAQTLIRHQLFRLYLSQYRGSAHPRGHKIQPYNCNFRGTVKTPGINVIDLNTLTYPPRSEGFTASAQKNCRDACFATLHCQSWSLDRSKGPNEACTLYSSRIRGMGPKADASSSMLFNNVACTSAVTASGLADSDFDEGSLSSWNLGVNSPDFDFISAVDADMYEGSGSAVRIQAGDGTNGSADTSYISQVFTLCPGTTYDVDIDYYVPSSEQSGDHGYPFLEIETIGSSNPVFIYIDDTSQDQDMWKTASGTLRTDDQASTNYRLSIQLTGSVASMNTVIFDNLVFYPVNAS